MHCSRRPGAPTRVGFDMAGGGPLLTVRVPHDPTRHVADNALGLVAAAFGLDESALREGRAQPASCAGV